MSDLTLLVGSWLAAWSPVMIALVFFVIIWNIVLKAFTRG